MEPHQNGAGRVNSFALVAYIPDPLGSFLDRLRQKLEPNSLSPKAHVTILPPRQLPDPGMKQQAWNWLCGSLNGEPAFNISAGGIEIFPGTHVIYLSVADGFHRLRELHHQLNADSLQFEERFPYHPHITLAQNLTQQQARELAEEASRLWAGFHGPRSFSAERLTFVQETSDKRWIDLHQLPLAHAGVLRS